MPVSTATDQPFQNLLRPGGKLPDPMQKGFFNYCPSETWTPNVNLYESGTSYVVCVDLAGVDKNQIDVVVEDQTLRIRGTREVPTPQDLTDVQKRRVRIHLMEIDHGHFCREVKLPEDVERGKIVANHRNGMLWIELPKKKK